MDSVSRMRDNAPKIRQPMIRKRVYPAEEHDRPIMMNIQRWPLMVAEDNRHCLRERFGSVGGDINKRCYLL